MVARGFSLYCFRHQEKQCPLPSRYGQGEGVALSRSLTSSISEQPAERSDYNPNNSLIQATLGNRAARPAVPADNLDPLTPLPTQATQSHEPSFSMGPPPSSSLMPGGPNERPFSVTGLMAAHVVVPSMGLMGGPKPAENTGMALSPGRPPRGPIIMRDADLR